MTAWTRYVLVWPAQDPRVRGTSTIDLHLHNVVAALFISDAYELVFVCIILISNDLRFDAIYLFLL